MTRLQSSIEHDGVAGRNAAREIDASPVQAPGIRNQDGPRNRDGPGGWVILDEPELHLHGDVDDLRPLAHGLPHQVGVTGVVAARALCEAAIDFADEDLPELENTRLAQEIARVRDAVAALTATFARTRVRYEGARAVLVGRPNVGKSSVLNALAGRERAIVTPVAGTTRDVLEAAITVCGVPVIVADTAGLRETDDVVERAGVERTHAALADAGCALAVFDGSAALDAADRAVAAAVRDRPLVAIVNKRDLPAVTTTEDVVALLGDAPIVELSALRGDGLGALEAAIARVLLAGGEGDEAEVGIFRERHRDAVRRAAENLARAAQTLDAGAPLELVASDLAAAARALGTITGEVTSEDVLDRVFAEFCIGK